MKVQKQNYREPDENRNMSNAKAGKINKITLLQKYLDSNYKQNLQLWDIKVTSLILWESGNGGRRRKSRQFF